MPVNVSNIIEVLAEILDEKNIRVSVQESLKGGLIAGSCAAVGGLLLGPIGLGLGGTIGSVFAATSSAGKFKSAAEILRNMSPAQKQRLINKIKKAFSEFGYENLMNFAMLILTTTDLKELAFKEAMNFLRNDMNLRIMQ